MDLKLAGAIHFVWAVSDILNIRTKVPVNKIFRFFIRERILILITLYKYRAKF
jgi:hypothetical protein